MRGDSTTPSLVGGDQTILMCVCKKVVSEPTFYNPQFQVMNDHHLYQRVDNIFQNFKRKNICGVC